MKIYQTSDIRNIALVGGAKSGKTTMAEAMAFNGGVINRRGTVEDKNTISDYRDIEIDRRNSVNTSLLYTEFGGKKINILDVPGFADFQGELVAAYNVVEAAVVVVNAQSGIEVGTEIAYRYSNKLNTPMIFTVNHLDAEKANFDDCVNQLKDYFGGKCTVLQFPVNQGLGFNQVVDIVLNKLLTFKDGKCEMSDVPAAYADKAEELRMALVEEAAAADDAEDATTVVAAANADAEFDVTGTWTSSAYITADGTEYTPADYAAANGVEEETVTVTYTFDAEGKATCTALGATVEGTYTIEGTKVKTAFTGSAPEFEYDAEKDTLTNTDPATGIVSVMSRA